MQAVLSFFAHNSAAITTLIVLVLGAPPAVIAARVGKWILKNKGAIGTCAAAAFEHYVKDPAVDKKIGELCLYVEQKLKNVSDPGGYQRFSLVFKEARKFFPELDDKDIEHKIESFVPVVNSILGSAGKALTAGEPVKLEAFTPPPVQLSDEATQILKAIAANTSRPILTSLPEPGWLHRQTASDPVPTASAPLLGGQPISPLAPGTSTEPTFIDQPPAVPTGTPVTVATV